MDCEGNPFSLHDLCAENAAYVYSYADWCPICKELASSTLQQRQDALGPSGLQTVLIVEDGSGGPATAFLCKQVRAKYKLTFPVLYDPTQSFKTHFAQGGPNEINLVLDQGGAITYLKRYASQVEVEAAIKAALE
jgi:peroxiredoxin